MSLHLDVLEEARIRADERRRVLYEVERRLEGGVRDVILRWDEKAGVKQAVEMAHIRLCIAAMKGEKP